MPALISLSEALRRKPRNTIIVCLAIMPSALAYTQRALLRAVYDVSARSMKLHSFILKLAR